MAKAKVFLDSSVIITALLSTRGGSFYILDNLKDNFDFQTNDYGLREIQEILKSKFANEPALLGRMFLLLGTAGATILPSPGKKERNSFAKYISVNDAPILASAAKHSDYLLTLDNEFFKPKILEMAEKKSLRILKPKAFIENFRR